MVVVAEVCNVHGLITYLPQYCVVEEALQGVFLEQCLTDHYAQIVASLQQQLRHLLAPAEVLIEPVGCLLGVADPEQPDLLD